MDISSTRPTVSHQPSSYSADASHKSSEFQDRLVQVGQQAVAEADLARQAYEKKLWGEFWDSIQNLSYERLTSLPGLPVLNVLRQDELLEFLLTVSRSVSDESGLNQFKQCFGFLGQNGCLPPFYSQKSKREFLFFDSFNKQMTAFYNGKLSSDTLKIYFRVMFFMVSQHGYNPSLLHQSKKKPSVGYSIMSVLTALISKASAESNGLLVKFLELSYELLTNGCKLWNEVYSRKPEAHFKTLIVSPRPIRPCALDDFSNFLMQNDSHYGNLEETAEGSTRATFVNWYWRNETRGD